MSLNYLNSVANGAARPATKAGTEKASTEAP
jgi:hypothetical protein